MRRHMLLMAVAGCFLAALTGDVALEASMAPVHIDPTAKPARFISEYHLFVDAQRQIPNEGVVPYDLNTPLFSDYAAKHRFVWMPPGQSASYDENDAFTFPVGTVLVKTFSFPIDMRDPAKGERVIETRLLIHTTTGWIGLPYLWNENTTEARLAVAGATVDVEWTHSDGTRKRIDYIVPNMNQCKQCHEIGGTMLPIGPKTRHLNRDYDYGDACENQLVRWTRIGYLSGAPADLTQAPRVPNADKPESGTVEARARAWLDINCAHCHNPDGPAYTSGLDLSWDQSDPARIGVMKPPVAAGRAAQGWLFGIVPGKPDESILMHRVESIDPGIMMPPLPRRLVHDEGAALIRQWIAEMP